MSDLLRGWYVIGDDGEPRPAESMKEVGTVNRDLRRVALTELDDVRVSTVFLGLDHGWGDGPPVLWETMIFNGPHDGYQERYTSKADALKGHELAVRIAKGEIEPPD